MEPSVRWCDVLARLLAELAGPNRPGALSRRRSRRAVLRTLLRMDLPADSAVDDAEVRVLARRPAELRLYEVSSCVVSAAQ